MGRLEDNQLEDATFLPLKPLFDKNFILGHIQLAKTNSHKDFNIICTIKPSLNQEMSIHQGILAVIRIKKDNSKLEIQPIYSEYRCQTFCVIPIGEKWAMVSLHEDGCLQMTLSGKISKALIEEEIKNIKEFQNQKDTVNMEKIDKIRSSIKDKISLDLIKNQELVPTNHFREFSSQTKLNDQYTLSKIDDIHYEVKYSKFSKIITGLSLPAFGNIVLPTRTVKNTMQVGFSNLEALYFYAQGSLVVQYQKNEIEKYSRDLNHLRML